MDFLKNVLSAKTLEAIKSALGDKYSEINELTKGINISAADEKLIPKAVFDEANSKKKELEQQIEELGKKATDYDGLKSQIEKLQETNKTKAAEYEATISKIKLDNAYNTAVGGLTEKQRKLIDRTVNRAELKLVDDKIDGFDAILNNAKADFPEIFGIEEGVGGTAGADGGVMNPEKSIFGFNFDKVVKTSQK